MQRPSLLKAALDDHRQGSLSSEVGSGQTLTTSSRPWCSCQPRVRKHGSKKYFWNTIFFIRSTDKNSHTSQCPLIKYAKSQTTCFGVNVLFCNYFLKGILFASMLATTGAGGWSISPNLGFRNTVNDSPAFAIVYQLGGVQVNKESGRMESVICCPSHIQAAIQQLQEVFAEGRASPSDLDILGDTILHVSETNDISPPEN
jgi:hypothetical protein